jgi:hypothetical protein
MRRSATGRSGSRMDARLPIFVTVFHLRLNSGYGADRPRNDCRHLLQDRSPPGAVPALGRHHRAYTFPCRRCQGSLDREHVGGERIDSSAHAGRAGCANRGIAVCLARRAIRDLFGQATGVARHALDGDEPVGIHADGIRAAGRRGVGPVVAGCRVFAS